MIECLLLQHFLREEPVVGIEYEAQLQKTLLPRMFNLLAHSFCYSLVMLSLAVRC